MTSRRPPPWFLDLLRKDRAAAARQRAVAGRMLDALARSDAAALRRVVGSGTALLVDSGGQAGSPGAAVHGRDAVTASLVDLLGGHTGMSGTAVEVNGSSGLALRRDARVVAVVTMRIRRSRAAEIWVVVNPAKLRHWNRD